MVDVNSTIELLSPIIAPIHGLLDVLTVTVGGIFGLYVILIYLRWRESRIMNNHLINIGNDLKAIAKKMGVVTVHKRDQNLWTKIKHFFKK